MSCVVLEVAVLALGNDRQFLCVQPLWNYDQAKQIKGIQQTSDKYHLGARSRNAHCALALSHNITQLECLKYVLVILSKDQ